MILLVHGWGYDASLWDPVAGHLHDLPLQKIDLGFFGKPALGPLPPGALGVGHSLGFLWLLQNARESCAGLIAVNGFPRFTARDDFPAGHPDRSLDRMIAKFERDPETVLRDFYARAGAIGPAFDQGVSLDPARLLEALYWLKRWDGRYGLEAFSGDCRALIGAEDRLLGPDLAEAGFPKSRCRILPGDHVLPLSAPAAIAAEIRAAWNERSDKA